MQYRLPATYTRIHISKSARAVKMYGELREPKGNLVSMKKASCHV